MKGLLGQSDPQYLQEIASNNCAKGLCYKGRQWCTTGRGSRHGMHFVQHKQQEVSSWILAARLFGSQGNEHIDVAWHRHNQLKVGTFRGSLGATVMESWHISYLPTTQFPRLPTHLGHYCHYLVTWLLRPFTTNFNAWRNWTWGGWFCQNWRELLLLLFSWGWGGRCI